MLAKSGAEKIFIIGGAQIYKVMLPFCSKLYLTLVDDSPVADSFFPEYIHEFSLQNLSKTQSENGINYRFAEFIRTKS